MMVEILVVCTANICRSPVAEALLRDRLERRAPGEFNVSSAGTWAYDGALPSANGTIVMARRGIDISGHRSRLVSEGMLAAADLILCMEAGHAEAIKAEFPRHAERIYLIAEMAGANHSVRDPFGGPMEGYVAMVDELTALINAGLKHIIALARENAFTRAR